jgi:hypothetical protein
MDSSLDEPLGVAAENLLDIISRLH